MRMNRAEYRDVYLRSDHWRETRLRALEAAGNRCQVCNSDRRLDVHHRTYERLGREAPGDLTVLCRGCHELYHGSKHKLAGESKAAARAARVGQVEKPPKTRPTHPHEVAVLRVLAQAPYRQAEIVYITGLPASKVNAALNRLKTGNWIYRRNKRDTWRIAKKGRLSIAP